MWHLISNKKRIRKRRKNITHDITNKCLGGMLVYCVPTKQFVMTFLTYIFHSIRSHFIFLSQWLNSVQIGITLSLCIDHNYTKKLFKHELAESSSFKSKFTLIEWNFMVNLPLVNKPFCLSVCHWMLSKSSYKNRI